MSTLTGISVRTIHRIENGHSAPSSESEKALAAGFDIPFANFEPSKSVISLGKKERVQQASNANPSPDLVSTFSTSWRGKMPYTAASFVAVSAHLVNELYSQIGQLSEDYIQLGGGARLVDR